MGNSTMFDYYYGGESNLFSFYRIPRQLITGDAFKRLSTDAKLLYGLLLDRMSLSAKHGWYDEQGRVYIYYTLEEIQADMNCGHEKAVKLLAELDASSGENLPTAQVKSRFYQLDSGHLEYVFDCLRKNTTEIRNIRAYLLTALYNAPATISNYYQAAVQHDFGP